MPAAVELLLRFGCLDRFLVRVSDLGQLEGFPPDLVARLAVCHIYLLCKRPRVGVVPGSVSRERDWLRFEIHWKSEGVLQVATVRIPCSGLAPGGVTFEASGYPHREIVARGADGGVVATILVANYAHVLVGAPVRIGVLETLYVGKGLSKNARDRLAVHEKVQEILAYLNSNDPDQELFVLLYAFDRMKKDALVAPYAAGTARVRERIMQARRYRPSKEEQVSLIEAALITYFRPLYNVLNREFPKKRSKLARGAQAADFAALVVELSNTTIGDLPVGSPSVRAASEHLVNIPLRDVTGPLASFFQGREKA